MKLIITGGSGYLGRRLVRQAAERHDIRYTYFTRDPLEQPFGVGIDLHNDQAFRDLAESFRPEAIIHTAAVYRWWAKDSEEIRQPALVGTRNIFRAAKQAGVRRMVYTSSVVAIGTTPDPTRQLTAEDWNESPHTP